MRTLAWMVLGAAIALAPAEATAQTYDPSYPICMQVYGRGGNYITCSYTSMSQCKFSASGRAAQCLVNPYYANAYPRRRFAY